MISSSRSTTMPSTLQGKWCQSTAEIWGSCYCININMEMNYWFAGGANLLDSGKSLIGWFNSQIPAGRITAKNMYKVTPKSYTFENGKMTFTDSADDKDDVQAQQIFSRQVIPHGLCIICGICIRLRAINNFWRTNYIR